MESEWHFVVKRSQPEEAGKELIMTEVMPYIAAILGFLAVYVLNSIKQEMRDIKTSLNSLERDMREGVSSLDRRVTIMETRCSSNHGHPEQ